MSEVKPKIKQKDAEYSLLDPIKVKDIIENAEGLAVENQEKKVRQKIINSRQRILCYMAACGASQKEMATATKFHPRHVHGLMQRGMIKKEIIRLQAEIFGKDPKKKFAQIFPKAVKVAQDVMEDKKTKPGVRAAQARDFMDRHAGKPLQRIENETTIVSELIMRLDDSAKSPVEEPEGQVDNEVIDVTPEPEKKEQSEIDVDSWIDENLET